MRSPPGQLEMEDRPWMREAMTARATGCVVVTKGAALGASEVPMRTMHLADPGVKPLPCPACHRLPGARVILRDDAKAVVVGCAQCSRQVTHHFSIPANCRSRNMVQRQVSRHLGLAYREWNAGVLSPRPDALVSPRIVAAPAAGSPA